jgi:hypothetical protein
MPPSGALPAMKNGREVRTGRGQVRGAVLRGAAQGN